METDYISRDSALRAVVDAVELYPHEYDAITKEINFIPAADVRPVVRGRWMYIVENAYHVCSNCAGVMSYDPEKGFLIFNTLPNFCPQCGADMREVVEIDQVKKGAQDE